MNTKRRRSSFKVKYALLLLIPVALLSACGGALLGNWNVPEGAGVALPQEEPVAGNWKGRDIAMNYRMSRSGDTLKLDGIVAFDTSMRYNFQFIPTFVLRAHLVDGGGQVLKTDVLTSASYPDPEATMSFTDTIQLPAGAEAIAFSYSGEATGAGDDNRIVRAFFDKSW